ncbi:phosphohydrolase [Paenibacillus sp. CAA11]|uniref:AAA family ATPase n=1 Tax=Paenibacillus sp. CAA11 TaxID=1532905 RepID=UPI000D36C203|nr:AAA family ATPase [Paenibacillus sp. CAA11]AWB43738.1 phosphohydrolase [Paenibacillus sp. CAA11]
MNKIMMLSGIPGSGKTHYAKQLAKEARAVIVSTDAIRGELFGSELKQKDTYAVYDHAFQQIAKAAQAGRNVVFDATNTERSRRLQFLKRFSAFPVECHVLDAPYELAAERISQRKRKIPERILLKYARGFEFPVQGEGFEAIHIAHNNQKLLLARQQLEELLSRQPGHDQLFAALAGVGYFRDMVGFDQENPYHSKSLSEHTFAVLDYINTFYEGEHLLELQLAALFHDAGKPLSKVWKASRGYYSYYGHEHVSAIIACHVLKELEYDNDFILHVVNLVSMHMEILHGKDAGASRIYHLLGPEMLSELYFFAEADSYAK